MTAQVSTNRYATARFIVDTNGLSTGCNFTTITAAVAAAVSGQTIFIRPGTYSESFTLGAGINLAAYECDAFTPNVNISGKITCTDAGARSISGIRLQTNSDNLLVVSGSVATVVRLINCYLNCTNNTGISLTSSSASSVISVSNCGGDLGTTGIALFANSGSGTLAFNKSDFSNTGGSSTASTVSSGAVLLQSTSFTHPITTSGTAIFTMWKTRIDTAAQNVTALTIGGSGVQSCVSCDFYSGTATAITITSSFGIQKSFISSSNAANISGAGTIAYSSLSFNSLGTSNITTTTQSVRSEGPSRIVGSANSGNTNTLTVTNSSNTATSSANILSTVGGSSAGDAQHQSSVSGVTTWTWGIDNSVTSPTADPWVLSQGTALGTNDVMSVATSGEINYPLQPAFFAYLATSDLNVTGQTNVLTIGSVTALTEVFDQNGDFNTNGTFTAPVTGRYHLTGQAALTGCTVNTGGAVLLVTSNRSHQFSFVRVAAATDVYFHIDNLCDMDAADTCVCRTLGTGEAGVTDDLLGSSTIVTYFSGKLSA